MPGSGLSKNVCTFQTRVYSFCVRSFQTGQPFEFHVICYNLYCSMYMYCLCFPIIPYHDFNNIQLFYFSMCSAVRFNNFPSNTHIWYYMRCHQGYHVFVFIHTWNNICIHICDNPLTSTDMCSTTTCMRISDIIIIVS